MLYHLPILFNYLKMKYDYKYIFGFILAQT